MKKLIKDLVNIQTGLFAKPTDKGEVVYLQSKHFNENGELQSELHPDLLAVDISEKHFLRGGDVLFAAKGTKNFAAVYESQNPTAVASTSFFILRVISKEILPNYLSWFLNHPETQKMIKDNARGTAIPSIRKTVLEDIEISIPSIEKQRSIIQLSILMRKEIELRMSIIKQRKQLIEQEIINILN